MFITCYARAYVKGFSSKNIKSGFNAAGIYPFRPSRAYNSRQVVQPPSDVVDAKVSDSPTSVLKTPKSGVDIRQLWTRFRDEITQNSNTRLFGRKVEKALDLKHAEIVGLMKENTDLKAELEARKPRKRKQVEIDPNERFANIEQIKKARDDIKAREEAMKEREDAVNVEALEESSKDMKSRPWEAYTSILDFGVGSM